MVLETLKMLKEEKIILVVLKDLIHRPKDRPQWQIQARIQSHKERIGMQAPLNYEGLKYLIIWDIVTRLSLT